MSTKPVNRSCDEEIIDIVRSIMSHGSMVVETVNESVLIKLMELRGTPIAFEKTHRDIEVDFEYWLNQK